ncbi:MAG TPA: potassium/proton antiporter [Segeticoccus sp.]|uniref:potassium/proton antiporter n=1 Tax=Segeticoccus sp. TaxID=2706531 RepID=UPI002D8116C1|nr:potassium/proton antiporter [Segeticoccus sp.]HET8600058.1 potassium/proton antiporter [Segeticoccus sp.]
MPIAQAPALITNQQLTPFLLVGTLVLLTCVVAVRFAVRSGLPTLLIYLAIGVALGDGGLGIRFSSADLTQVLGYSALVLILAEGGLTTSWRSIEKSVAPAGVLATVGIVVSVLVVGSGAHYLLHLPWTIALVLGAVVSSTDAAAVFSVLRRVPLPPRLTGILEAESSFNDPPAVLIVVALADQAAHGSSGPLWLLALTAIGELAGGAVIGAGIGWAGGKLLPKAASTSSGLFSIGILALPVLAYALANQAHTSGFIATYVAALILGNLPLPHRPAVRGFAQAMGWVAQIGLFVLLGLLASPGRLVHQLVPAVVIGLVLLLVARPLSVLIAVTPFRIPLREQAFLSWAGLRGAVPIVLATVPATAGIHGVDWLFDLVFVLVVIFTLVQGPTLPWVAQRLGLGDVHHTVDVELEVTPLEELGADVLQVQIGQTSQLAGVEVFELRLPTGADVTLVVRDGEAIVPAPDTILRHGDQLLIVATPQSRARAEARIRAVSEGGRLAEWHRSPPAGRDAPAAAAGRGVAPGPRDGERPTTGPRRGPVLPRHVRGAPPRRREPR